MHKTSIRMLSALLLIAGLAAPSARAQGLVEYALLPILVNIAIINSDGPEALSLNLDLPQTELDALLQGSGLNSLPSSFIYIDDRNPQTVTVTARGFANGLTIGAYQPTNDTSPHWQTVFATGEQAGSVTLTDGHYFLQGSMTANLQSLTFEGFSLGSSIAPSSFFLGMRQDYGLFATFGGLASETGYAAIQPFDGVIPNYFQDGRTMYAQLPDMVVAFTAEVPEPITLVLCAFGLVVVGFGRYVRLSRISP